VLIAATGEVTKDISAETTDVNGENAVPARIFTFKAAGGITGYVPLTPRVTLALSVRGGKIFALEPDSLIITPKRFFLGGATTLRGFRDDAVIPQDVRGEYARERAYCDALAWTGGCTSRGLALRSGGQLPSEGGTLFELAKAELRFALVGDFELVFFEAGNFWPGGRPEAVDLRPRARGVLRHPGGALALDVASICPRRPAEQPIFAIQFSVGLF
jgi:outer membrane protein assembly factor BamA